MTTATTSVIAIRRGLPRAWALPLYAITLFLSAFLLFWVQPLYGKMILPLMGGAPAVWNTAMVFFQALLLTGYAYAHLAARFLGLRSQTILHLAIFAAAILVLPFAPPDNILPPDQGAPTLSLLMLFATAVGLPFFALAGNAPLLQRWFSRTGHADAADPYFLYSSSNVGSLLALLGYPFLIEPIVGLQLQSVFWTLGFAILALLIFECSTFCQQSATTIRVPEARLDNEVLDWRRRGYWILLAFIPSSLLLGVTTHISTDVAAVPLLWVVPLALYLLTYVIVFARKSILPLTIIRVLQPVLIVAAVITCFINYVPIIPNILINLGAFFVTALVCHGALAANRPSASHLTEFYLFMSLGGVLGGIFNAIVAPSLFNQVLEYPIVLALALLWRPTVSLPVIMNRLLSLPRVRVIGLALLLAMMITITLFGDIDLVTQFLMAAIVASMVAGAYLMPPTWSALGLASLVLMSPLFGDPALATKRSFFGVYKVEHEPQNDMHLLIHGTTIHGMQRWGNEGKPDPLSYYHRQGPFGRLMTNWSADNPAGRVAAVGLGAGSAACYAAPGQDWIFFEIDPTVTALARDPSYFTFLNECMPQADVVHGDARLSLRYLADNSADLLILDAFSSDAIPVHLMTHEAFALYDTKLAAGGWILVHVSNRHLDLEAIVARVTAEQGFRAWIFEDNETAQSSGDPARVPSTWIVLKRSGDTGDSVVALGGESLVAMPETPLWTDDHSDILRVINW